MHKSELLDTLEYTGEQALKLWQKFDTDGSGKLSRKEGIEFCVEIVERMKSLGTYPNDTDILTLTLTLIG